MVDVWDYSSGGESGLRIFKGDTDDPTTANVPITDYESLLFDSLNPNQIRVKSVHLVDIEAMRSTYVNDTAQWVSPDQSITLTLRADTGSSFSPERVDIANSDLGQMVRTYGVDSDGWTLCYHISRMFAFDNSFLLRYFGYYRTVSGFESQSSYVHPVKPNNGNRVFTKQIDKIFIVVFDLPSDDRAFSFASGPAVSGSLAYDDTNGVVIPRSGYAADTVDLDQHLVSDDRRAALCVATGEVAVNSGQTVSRALLLGIDYGPNIVVTVQARLASETSFFEPFDLAKSAGDYFDANAVEAIMTKVENEQLSIRNETDQDLVVRYLVFADDDRPAVAPTSQAQIEGTFSDGANPYYQIRRVGSTNPPRLGDIRVDSRFSYLPIVASGILDIDAPSGDAGSIEPPQTYDVLLPQSYQNSFPIVFFSYAFRNKNLSGENPPNWVSVASPTSERMLAERNDLFTAQSSYSTTIEVLSDRIRFRLYQRHPYRMEWDVSGNILDGFTETLDRDYIRKDTVYDFRIFKLRYFIALAPSAL